jgi:ThiF family
VQLFITDEILAEVRRHGHPRGRIRCAESEAKSLFALLPREAAGATASELYPDLRTARDAHGSRLLPFVMAEIPGGPGPWALQPGLSLIERQPGSRWLARRMGLPNLPSDYQPYLRTMLQEGREGLLVVGATDAAFIRRRRRHGVPDGQWGRLPMSTSPVVLCGVGEGPLVAGRSFVLIGAGSLGSRAAELLAAGGAQEIVLVDPDLLERRNLRRHLCGVEHLGRPKVDAVADALRERGFPTIVRPVKGRAQVELADEVRELIAASDMALCTTDSAPPRQFVNHAALHAGVPSLIANVQLRPEPVAEILLTMPDRGGCWNCWRAQLERDGIMQAATRHDPADYPQAEPRAPSGLPMYQLTAVAAAACDLAGIAFAEGTKSMKWLMALDTAIGSFPGLSKPRIPLFEELDRLPTCEVCAR